MKIEPEMSEISQIPSLCPQTPPPQNKKRQKENHEQLKKNKNKNPKNI